MNMKGTHMPHGHDSSKADEIMRSGSVDDHTALRALNRTSGIQRIQAIGGQVLSTVRPRDENTVMSRAEHEARMLGDAAYYAWGKGKDAVQGVSVKLAMVLARCWGNCEVDAQLVGETPDAWIYEATFFDKETGFTYRRPFRQSKEWTVYGKFDNERKDDMRFQIGASKAVRNVILNALPEWYVSRAIDAAMGGVREKIEQAISQYGIDAIRQKAIEALARYAQPEKILAYIGRKHVSQLDINDLVHLRTMLTAFESGAEDPATFFQQESSAKSTVEAAAERLSAIYGPASTTTQETDNENRETQPQPQEHEPDATAQEQHKETTGHRPHRQGSRRKGIHSEQNFPFST